MKMLRVTALILLAGCVNRMEQAAQFCEGHGFQPGTEPYAECLNLVAQQQQQESSNNPYNALLGVMQPAPPKPTTICHQWGMTVTCQ